MLFVCLITKWIFNCSKHGFWNSWNSNMHQFSLSHIFEMENGIRKISVSKWSLIPVENIDNKITIWPPDDMSLIYLCWVTFMYQVLNEPTVLRIIWTLGHNILCALTKFWGQLAWGPALFWPLRSILYLPKRYEILNPWFKILKSVNIKIHNFSAWYNTVFSLAGNGVIVSSTSYSLCTFCPTLGPKPISIKSFFGSIRRTLYVSSICVVSAAPMKK